MSSSAEPARKRLSTFWTAQVWLSGKLDLRHWRRDCRQTLVLILTLSLGVAAFLSVRMANRSALAGFGGFLEPVGGSSDWTLRAAAGPLRNDDLEKLRELTLDMDLRAVPVLEGTAALVQADGKVDTTSSAPLQLLGLDLIGLRNLNPNSDSLRLLGQDGTDFWSTWQDPTALFANPDWVRMMKLRVGDEVRLLFNDQLVILSLRGILEPIAGGPAIPSNLLVMDLPALQLWTGREDQVDRVELFKDPNSPSEVADQRITAVAERAPMHWRLESTQAVAVEGDRMTAAFRLNLQILSLIALLAGMFLVSQAMDAAVVRRRQEIGILRSLGVSRLEIGRNWLIQILILGFAGSAGGLLLGWLLAQFTVTAVARTINALYQSSNAGAAALRAEDVILALVLGMVGSLIGGWLPLRDAMATPPAQVMRTGNWSPGLGWMRRSGLGWAVIGIGVLLAFAPAVVLPGGQKFPLAGHAAAFLWLTGGALVAGNVIPWIASLWQKLPNNSAPLRLALSRLRRGSSRHRLAAAGLFVATAMAAAMTILIGSFERTVTSWLEVRLQADVYISSAGLAGADSRQFISAATLLELQEHPDVAAVDPFRSMVIQFEERPTLLNSSDFALIGTFQQLLWHQPLLPLEQMPAEATDWVIGNETFTSRFARKRGDIVEIPTSAGMQRLWLRGIQADYGNDLGALLIDRNAMQRWFDINDATNVSLFVKAEVDVGSVVDDLRTRYPNLVVRNQTELRSLALSIFRQTFAVTEALKFLALVVALSGLGLGLVSILRESKQALQIQRALGFSRSEMARTAAWEGLGIALAGIACGLVTSLGLGWLMIHVINKQSFGWTLQLTAPWAELGIFSVALLLCAWLVAWSCGRWGANLPSEQQE